MVSLALKPPKTKVCLVSRAPVHGLIFHSSFPPPSLGSEPQPDWMKKQTSFSSPVIRFLNWLTRYNHILAFTQREKSEMTMAIVKKENKSQLSSLSSGVIKSGFVTVTNNPHYQVISKQFKLFSLNQKNVRGHVHQCHHLPHFGNQVDKLVVNLFEAFGVDLKRSCGSPEEHVGKSYQLLTTQFISDLLISAFSSSARTLLWSTKLANGPRNVDFYYFAWR